MLVSVRKAGDDFIIGQRGRIQPDPVPFSIWKGGLIGEYIPGHCDVDDDKADNLDESQFGVGVLVFYKF